MKFWVCVVSKEHALRGINGGFIQVCHGKAAPLKRMKTGDFITFYCSSITFMGKEKYQNFLGIGQVKDDTVYQFSMNEDFHPFRMNIEYYKNSAALEAAIHPILDQLGFIKDKDHWGYIFKFGHFNISKEDFLKIMKAMCAPAEILNLVSK